MKKIGFVGLAIAGLLLVFSGCKNPSGGGSDDTSHQQDAPKITTSRYIAASDSTAQPELVKVYADDGTDYFIYHLGTIDDVPVAYETANRYNGTPVTCTFSKTTLDESVYSESQTTAESHVETASLSESAGLGLTYGLVSVNAGISAGWSVTNEQSSEETITSAEHKVNELTETYSYTVGNHGEAYGYYRYTLFVDCDVYALLSHDVSLDTWTCQANYMTCARPTSYNYALDYAKDNSDYSESTNQSSIVCNGAALVKDAKSRNDLLTITFTTNGGSSVESQICLPGGQLEEPDAPTKDNYSFAGWYADTSLTKKVSFPYAPDGSISLYAKWLKISNLTNPVSAGTQFNSLHSFPSDTSWSPYYYLDSLSDIAQTGGFDIAALKAAGYTTLTLKINFSRSESKNPYLRILVYNDTNGASLNSPETFRIEGVTSWIQTFSITEWRPGDSVLLKLKGHKNGIFDSTSLTIDANRKYTLTFSK